MHVFLATDGSPFSLSAEQLLAEFPFARKPRLTIAHVCPAADLHALEAAVTSPVTALLDRCRKDAAELLEQTAQRCRAWADPVETQLLDGHPANELLKTIDALRPDLVTVGARGLGAVRRMLLGSVSERLAKYSPCSVLVAQPPAGRTTIRQMVLAYDGSPAADAAVNRLAQFAPSNDRAILVLGIVETVRVYGTEMVLEGMGGIEQERLRARERLERVVQRLLPTARQVTPEVRTAPDVAGTILDAAEERRAELIVVGSRGKSAWERFLLGSVTLRVLHHAPCSVWIERVPGESE